MNLLIIFAPQSETMKVLLINTSEKLGGAAVACQRLMHALRKSGVEVNMLVRDKTTDNHLVHNANQGTVAHWINKFRFVFERFTIFKHNNFSKKNLFAVSIANSGLPLSQHPAVLEADVLHLHWINQGFLSLSEIDKLIRLGKPIVWTMHDMWPVTGICHHSRECNAYQTECKNCFLLKTPSPKDLSNQVFLQKQIIWGKANFQFVTCSKWLQDRARRSAIVDSERVKEIPNPLDVEFYSQRDKIELRKKLGLPLNKKLLLYGAANVADKRKGIDYFVEACRLLHKQYPEWSSGIELIFLGHVKESIDGLFPFPIHTLGYISDEAIIRDLYCMVDLFVTPSLEENLPNTIMESMACGTPVVGFEIGGIPEMIDHKKNGYLSKYKDALDFATGIYWCLSEADYALLSENARKKTENCYSETIVAQEYINLYSQQLFHNIK